jgi:hypothetical protein
VPGLGIPVGEAGAQLTFTHGNSSFLAAVGVKAHTLRSEQRLRAELRTKVEEGSFQLEHVVVTDVLRADAGRVFISDSANQEVMLRAKTALGPEPIELVSAGAQMSVVHQSEDILAYGGKRGMTPLFRIMGFKHGRQVRDYLRIFSRTRGVPRIRVKSIRTAPQVGSLIEISPLPSQQLVVAPTGAQPFWVERADVRPFRVEPTLIDPGTVELYFPPAARLLGAEEPGEQALVVGPLESEPSAGEELTMRPLGASPFVVEPLDGDPFLVNLPPGENLTFAPGEVEFLEGVVPAAVGNPPTSTRTRSASTTWTSMPSSRMRRADRGSSWSEGGGARWCGPARERRGGCSLGEIIRLGHAFSVSVLAVRPRGKPERRGRRQERIVPRKLRRVASDLYRGRALGDLSFVMPPLSRSPRELRPSPSLGCALISDRKRTAERRKTAWESQP